MSSGFSRFLAIFASSKTCDELSQLVGQTDRSISSKGKASDKA